MFPVICHIGPLTIYSYGVMMAMAIFTCGYFLGKEAVSNGIRKEFVYDLIFWCVFGGIIGARLFYIALNPGFFLENPLEVIMVQHGGLVWQGGLIAGAISGIIFVKRKKWDVLRVLDIFAPYLALGQAIGRLGCFLNGCCYGKPFQWGIYFPVHEAWLHPTQLYLSGALFLIFFILKKFQKREHQIGDVFLVFLILDAVQRFFIEFFRDDHPGTSFYLSTFQWTSILIVIASLAVHFYFKSCNQKKVHG